MWYFVTGQNRRPGQDSTPPADARRIVDERLARGEIDAEEYQRLRDIIGSDYPGPRASRPPVGTRGRR